MDYKTHLDNLRTESEKLPHKWDFIIKAEELKKQQDKKKNLHLCQQMIYTHNKENKI